MQRFSWQTHAAGEMLSARVKNFEGALRACILTFITGLSKTQFSAFSGTKLVFREVLQGIKKCSQKSEMFDLAIIIVGLHLFFFTSLIMKEQDFHTSKNNYFGCELPDVTCQTTRQLCPASGLK